MATLRNTTAATIQRHTFKRYTGNQKHRQQMVRRTHFYDMKKKELMAWMIRLGFVVDSEGEGELCYFTLKLEDCHTSKLNPAFNLT